MNFRLDRWATLYLASPCRKILPESEPGIPLLMYHSIADRDESAVHPYYRTATSPAIFEAQLNTLRELGYRACSLDQALRQLQQHPQSAAKSVVLTFDDGYRNFYTSAFPRLHRYGFTATVFLPTAFIGDAPRRFKHEDCMTWSEVRELQRHGIDFGSHTVTHPQLRELAPSAIQDEIANSKETIEQKLGSRVDSFAYPYAFPQTDRHFTRMLRGLLTAAGYVSGVCTIAGQAKPGSDRLFLERLPVNSGDDRAFFAAKLTGNYDWIGEIQGASKAVKSLMTAGLGSRSKLPVPNNFHIRTQPSQKPGMSS
jgi:peptidoglycan/xylan/chitin deacetylase (PgdA/CDA1 family)